MARPGIEGTRPTTPPFPAPSAALTPPDRAAPDRAEETPPSSPTPPAGDVVPATAEPKGPPAISVQSAPLLERADRLFGTGDVASARLFYERAADGGNSQAALRLGETYDPAFLERAQLRVPGDRGLAVFWYRRARELGADEAEILLKGMQTR